MSIETRTGPRGERFRARYRYQDPLTEEWETVASKWFRKREEAERADAKQKLDAERGVLLQGSAQPLGEYLRDWLADVSKVSKRGRPLAPTTAARYAGAVQHIVPIIGRVKIRDLGPVHVKRLRQKLSDGSLAPQTVGDVLRVLSQALQQAVGEGLVDRNVAAANVVHRPEGDPEPFVVIDQRLGGRILDAARGTDPWDVAAHLALGATLRREEVLGLQWKHVDLEAATLHVARTLTYAAGEYHYGPPKSKAGERTIALPRFVVAALRRHKAGQAERMLAIGARVDAEHLVVDDGTGEAWLPASFSKGWARHADAHGFGDVTYHGLRHGAATWLLAAGVPDSVAASIMGHADTRILRRYQEVVPELMQDAAARMDQLLGTNRT